MSRAYNGARRPVASAPRSHANPGGRGRAQGRELRPAGAGGGRLRGRRRLRRGGGRRPGPRRDVLRPRRPRRDAAEARRVRGPPDAARASHDRAGPHADRARQRARPGHGPRPGRGRLPHQAVRLRGAPGARPGPAAPEQRSAGARPPAGRPPPRSRDAPGHAGKPRDLADRARVRPPRVLPPQCGTRADPPDAGRARVGHRLRSRRATSSTCTSGTSGERSICRARRASLQTARGAGYVLRAEP